MAKEEVIESTEETTGTEDATPASTETAAPVESEAAANAANEEAAEAIVAQAYAANLKYKFLDKEKEFNPVFKDLVKNADIEKALKELHEKSDGLDFIKPKFHETREKLKAAETNYNTVHQEIAQLGTLLQKGDLDSFFDQIKVPHQKVYDWVLQKVREMDMPPEQRQYLTQARNAQKQAATFESQAMTQQEQLSQYAVQARTAQLDLATSQPEVKSFADLYDERVGEPGAFKKEVVKQGTLAFHTTGADLPAEEAVRLVMDTYGKFMQTGAPAAKPTPGVVMPSPNRDQQQASVIPNIQGKGGSSPAKRSFKSTDELRQLAQQMEG